MSLRGPPTVYADPGPIHIGSRVGDKIEQRTGELVVGDELLGRLGSEQDVARTTAPADSVTRQGDPVALQAALDSRVKLLRAENEQLERELADSRQV